MERVMSGNCPNCGKYLSYQGIKYCRDCGQAIDWESDGKEVYV